MTAPTYMHECFHNHLAETLGDEWERFKGSPDYHKLFRAFNAGYIAAKKEPPPEPKPEGVKKKVGHHNKPKVKRDDPNPVKVQRDAGDHPPAIRKEADLVATSLEPSVSDA